MGRERLIQCTHYICEGKCDIKGKECRFWREMQICPTYKKMPGGKPVRNDNRKQKEARRMRKEKWD